MINIDQTPAICSCLLLHHGKKGNQCVPVSGTANYCQIMVAFGVSLSGDFLPIQLIYQGKTKHCQPTYLFPHEFHIIQTENHWANKNLILDLIKEVLVSHVRKVGQKLSLPEDQQWLLIADIFKTHWTHTVVTEMTQSNSKMCAISNNMANIF